jgi:ActR/RegA family two-component response regulator
MTRVLVVDDDEDLADLLAVQLRRLGFEVDCAYSVAQARAHGEHGAYDALVTDGLLLDGTADAVAEVVPARARVLLAGSELSARPGFQKVLLKPAPAVDVGEAIRASLSATA